MPNKLQETLQIIKQPSFGPFLLTRFCLIFALFAQSTIISYFVYEITGNALSLGLLGLSEVIPAFLVSLPAGLLADKYNKTRILKICLWSYLAINIISIIILNYNTQLGVNTTVYLLYAITFLSGCARAFLAPCTFSLLPLIVPKSNYTKAISWSTTAWYSGSILGPLFAGFFLTLASPINTLFVISFFIIIALLAAFFIQVKEAARTPSTQKSWELLKEGFDFVFKTPLILSCLALDLFAVLFGGAESLLPIFSKDILHCGSVGYGFLRSAHGLGSILLTIVLIYLPLHKNAGKKLFASVALFGICIIVFALSKNIYLSFLLLFIGGMADCVSVVIRHNVLQINTPQEMKGRVASINTIFISSSNELGAFESGLAAQIMGTIPSVIFGGSITILVVIIIAFLSKPLRNYEQ